MMIYSPEVYMLLAPVALILLASIYFHFYKQKYQIALVLLILSGFCFRLIMAALDPFLQDWDERFHALVAKNMMDFPFKPMLRVDPLAPYKVEDWCCNHIWVHKQPLFLWQMAISMKLFGINELAVRIPSVLMGTISIYLIYDIAKHWIKQVDVAFVAGMLFAVSYYQLELTSGWFSLDQNDVAFSFYVTASIWAFIKYISSDKPIQWSIAVGFFVGCAVLNKWLTGILVFGGWGLYLLLHGQRKNQWQYWRNLIIACLVSLIVFLPWQVYIAYAFPLETLVMHKSNSSHILENLGHPGTNWFHLNHMRKIYGQFLLIFIPLGIYKVLSSKQIDRKLSISLLSMVLVVYTFFSLIVKTKMPALTFPVNGLIWIIVAIGIVMCYQSILQFSKTAIASIMMVPMAIYTLKPWQIADQRSEHNLRRNAKIENTVLHKNIDLDGVLKDRVILNCKSFEDVELMFYRNINAYHWYPEASVMDSLLQNGHKFAAFKSHNDQHLPEFIYNNPEIVIIEEDIK
jgi:4-amino-4-deoxy-L-arabinose transferase-like glycosyltransferase